MEIIKMANEVREKSTYLTLRERKRLLKKLKMKQLGGGDDSISLSEVKLLEDKIFHDDLLTKDETAKLKKIAHDYLINSIVFISLISIAVVYVIIELYYKGVFSYFAN